MNQPAEKVKKGMSTSYSMPFDEQFWRNKIGTWEMLSKTPIDGYGIMSSVRHIHNNLVSNEVFKDKIIKWLNNLVGIGYDTNLTGKFCVEGYVNPSQRLREIKRSINPENDRSVSQSIDRTFVNLLCRNIVDATWEGEREQENAQGPHPSTIVSPDFLLTMLLCNRYDATDPIRIYQIFEYLRIRKDVVLLLVEEEGKPLMMKCRYDSPVEYLRGRWVLPYFFVTKTSYTKKGTEQISTEAIGEIVNMIGDIQSISGTVQDRRGVTIMYLPPLNRGGNPLFAIDARKTTSDTLNKIKNFIKQSEYKISDFKSISWSEWWNMFIGKERFHYGSIITLAHIIAKENKTQYGSDEINKQLHKHLAEEFRNANYLDLLQSSNPDRNLAFMQYRNLALKI